jgi:hypothetical protein
MMQKYRFPFTILSFIILTAGTFLLSGAERDRSLIFEASFDDFSANAGHAEGSKTVRGLPESDLQLRMFPGIGAKSNALVLSNAETCRWELKNNLDPRQGTISFWLRNLNWQMTMPERQMFFYAYQGNFTLWIWKNWSPYVNVHINIIAGGKNQSFTLAARVDPEQWNTQKWHKIDLTWDQQDYKLYLDGKTPPRTPILIGKKSVPPTAPRKKFPPGTVFPEGQKTGVIGIGLQPAWKKSKNFNSSHRTAYNKLKIHNRVLSPDEIYQNYRSLIPDDKPEPNIVTIPQTGRSITPDGSLDSAEWKNAERVLMLEKLRGSIAGDISAQALVCRDRKNLYLGFSASKLCKKKAYTQADGPLWEDDSFEFHLELKSGDRYQFIVNSKGTLYDSHNTDPKWNAGASAAAKFNENGSWSAEIAIPLQALGDPSGEVKGNFTFTAHQGLGHFFRQWSNQSNYEFKPDSILRFAEVPGPVRLSVADSLKNGILELHCENSSPEKVSAGVVSVSGTRLDHPGSLGKDGWTTRLEEGMQTLTVSRGSSGQTDFRLVTRFAVQPEMEITHNSNPLKKVIHADVNFTGSGADFRQELDQGVQLKTSLTDPNGKTVFSGVRTVCGLRSSVDIPFPGNLARGIYRIRMEADAKCRKLTGEIPFRIPDLRPYQQKIGLDDSVPAPWFPVKTLERNRFEVLDRSYSFDGSSPFPQSVITRGTETLSHGPELILNGQKVRWTPYRISGSRKNHITLSGSGESGNAKLEWTGELWFDGMYKLELKMRPDQAPLKITGLSIRYSVTPEISRFALNPLYMPWKNGSAGIALGPAGRKDNLLWLTGHECGFAAWVKSNANWVNRPNEKVMTARKNARGADAALNIITVPAELKGTAGYTFVFMATPPRRPTVPPRSVNYHGYNFVKNNNYQSCSWGGFEKIAHADDTTSLNTLIPADPGQWKKHASYNRKGKKAHLYSMPGHVSDNEPDCDYLGGDLRSFPLLTHSGIKQGKKWTTYQYCGNASDLAADLWCWNFDRNAPLFKGYDYDGIYFDIGNVRFCSSKAHGCAGIDAFGQEYISSDALGLRNFYMRVYKTVKKHDGTVMIHSHVQFVPFVQDFCDMFSPGENAFYIMAKNLKYGYLEGITPEEYQTDLNWRKAGVAYQIIPQTARAAMMIPALKPFYKEVLRDPAYTLSAITAFAVHDLNLWASMLKIALVDRYWKIRKDINIDQASDYVGYWRPDCPVKSTSPKVYCGCYLWNRPAPYRCVLVISNFNRQASPLRLQIDWKKLKLDPKRVTLTDLWAQKPIRQEELSDRLLSGASFLLLGVR